MRKSAEPPNHGPYYEELQISLAAWFGSNLCLFVNEKINDYDVDLDEPHLDQINGL
jgi:hypothetical protein